MASLSKDKEATRLMQFRDKRSKVCLNGAHYYFGWDVHHAYTTAILLWDGNCGRCGVPVLPGDEDWEHIVPKSMGRRNDHPKNRRFIHGMKSKHDCHRAAHNREVQLKTIPALEYWEHGGEG